MLTTLAIANYRSLRDVVLPLERLNVVTGTNGTGKSSLYRAFKLLADAAEGRLVASLAREGGLPSTLWAGPETISREMKAGSVPVQGGRRRKPVQLRLGFARDDFSFAIDLGLPNREADGSAFALDPEIKRECVWAGPVFRPASVLLDRRGPALSGIDESGRTVRLSDALSPFASMLTEFADPKRAPEVSLVRDAILTWRFYDHLRTDDDAPARRPQVGTHTPVLDHDGGDVAAAVQTIREIGDAEALDEAIADAFPGSSLVVDIAAGRFQVAMRQPGMLRPLMVSELSDGTLRFILLAAALLTPRPPDLLVLNEPERSLHPDLVEPLARLIAAAADRSQVIVVSHNERLTEALGARRDCQFVRLTKLLGETIVDGQSRVDRPSWRWPER